MSGDPDQEYFSDGITEDIITELSRFRELFVIARNSSFSYKGKQVKVQEIGRDLGVAYIVEGSVRKAGSRIRITAQLIEAESGNHIWADRYDRELEDIFDLQDEITQTIVALLPVRLHNALVETMRRKPSENLSAYDHFLHGRWLFDRTAGQDPKALDLLKQAIEIDPACAQAHAYIALAHAYSLYNMQQLGETPAETALGHVQLALADGEGDHFVHAAAAYVFLMCGKHQLADTHSSEAIALNPNAIYALLCRGYVMCYLGEPAAGVERLISALKYDPHAPDFYHEQLAEGSYMARDYKRATRFTSAGRTRPGTCIYCWPCVVPNRAIKKKPLEPSIVTWNNAPTDMTTDCSSNGMSACANSRRMPSTGWRVIARSEYLAETFGSLTELCLSRSGNA